MLFDHPVNFRSIYTMSGIVELVSFCKYVGTSELTSYRLKPGGQPPNHTMPGMVELPHEE